MGTSGVSSSSNSNRGGGDRRGGSRNVATDTVAEINVNDQGLVRGDTSASAKATKDDVCGRFEAQVQRRCLLFYFVFVLTSSISMSTGPLAI